VKHYIPSYSVFLKHSVTEILADLNLEKFNQKLGERLLKNVKNETVHVKNETSSMIIQKNEQINNQPRNNFPPPQIKKPTLSKKSSKIYVPNNIPSHLRLIFKAPSLREHFLIVNFTIFILTCKLWVNNWIFQY